ncbi:MAG: putative DNA-binding domain-containing protein [Woeseiaceae bacterium]|nr:putative DNA-binding domain-containing protein [Woeseiaceae bacterium]
MANAQDFKDKQYAFAAHIRDPDNVPAPAGIESRRMAIYRELFFNNLYSLLGTFFPVLRKIHTQEQWRRFIRGFMQKHQAQTPYFLQLPEEFLGYLQAEFEPTDDDYPFLLELAHYEYAELALAVSEDENDMSGVDPNGDLLAEVPVKSSLSWSYAYHYAVHRISPDHLPRETESQPVYLALYRDANDEVGFLELNAITAALLDAIEFNESHQTGEQLLRSLAGKINYPDADALVAHGADALREMRQLGILTGTRSPA